MDLIIQDKVIAQHISRQLKNGTVEGTIIKDIDFVSCKLSGVLENCNFISFHLH